MCEWVSVFFYFVFSTSHFKKKIPPSIISCRDPFTLELTWVLFFYFFFCHQQSNAEKLVRGEKRGKSFGKGRELNFSQTVPIPNFSLLSWEIRRFYCSSLHLCLCYCPVAVSGVPCQVLPCKDSDNTFPLICVSISPFSPSVLSQDRGAYVSFSSYWLSGSSQPIRPD